MHSGETATGTAQVLCCLNRAAVLAFFACFLRLNVL